MTMTLYALHAFTGRDGTTHEAGEAIAFADDQEARELLRYGVCGATAPRRQAGDSSARVEPGTAS
jgi:hypothetical protein